MGNKKYDAPNYNEDLSEYKCDIKKNSMINILEISEKAKFKIYFER